MPSPSSPAAQASRSVWFDRGFALAVGVIFVAIPTWRYAAQHLASPNVWFDESGQFWLALGLHHFSEPLAKNGGWTQILEFGRVLNSDPGGFTALLRGWIFGFGASPIALRSLPFAFLLLTMAIIGLSVRRAGAPWMMAALAASVPLGYPMLLHYSTEIRAYSMEVCAVALLFCAPIWLGPRLDVRRTLILGLLAALLVASRYSAYFFAAAACITALLPLRPLPIALKRAVIFGVPIVVSVALGYLLFARLQAGGTHEPPAYVEAFLLKGKDANATLALLKENFMGRDARPLTLYLFLAPLFVWLGPAKLADFRRFVGQTWVFSVISLCLIAGASLVGKLPWALQTRWSIGYQGLSACCLAVGAVIILRWLSHFIPARFTTVALTVLVGTSGWLWSTQIERAVTHNRPYYETISDHLDTLARSPDPKALRFFVPSNASATLRYLCEYGPLRGTFDYPAKFHFETPEEVANRTSIPATQFNVIVLTHVSLADGYLARVAGTSSVQRDPQPSCLIILTP